MVLVDDDAPGDVQAQPGALADRFGGEEGFEDPRDVLGRDARAGVADLDLGGVVVPAGADGERARPVHRLDRVVDQVRPDLVELRAVHRHVGQRAVVLLDHRDAGQLAAEHDQRAVEQFVDVEHLERGAVHLRVLLGRADQRRDPRPVESSISFISSSVSRE